MDMNRAFEEVPIGLCYFDRELRYEYINDWLAELNGFSPEDHRGRTIQEVIPDVATNVVNLLLQVMESGEPLLNGEVVAETPAQPGVLRTFKHSYMPVKSDNGSVIGLSCVVEDITALRETEKNLILAKDQAESANRAKSEFLSSMNHELRTPLNAVIGFAQIMEDNAQEPLSEKQKFAVENILGSSNYLHQLIDQVLQLNKIEAGQLSLNIEEIPARTVIDESLSLIQHRAVQEGIKILNQTAGEDLPVLWVDRMRITQALLNLMSNAVKYNRKNGTITLSSEQITKQMIRINIADTGIGIPAELQDKLFDPFERLGHEMGKIEGSGIGLTITKQIIKLLGGQVGFESEQGKGSTFWVDIPISTR